MTSLCAAKETLMNDLTAPQARVVAFLRGFLGEHGYPPTHAEIAAGLGFRSPNAAAEHLKLLLKKGVVEVTPGLSRGLRLSAVFLDAVPKARAAGKPVRAAALAMDLAVIGRVAAGQPVLADEHVMRRVAIDPRVFRPTADYLLAVRGDSMVDAGILNGDLVAVHRVPRVAEGSIAVVRLDDEVTVKRWRVRSGRVVLEPANRTLKPMIIDPARTHVAIEGLVVGVLRADALAPAR